MIMRCKAQVSQPVVSEFQDPGAVPAKLLQGMDFPGKSTGEGCLCLLRLRAHSRLSGGAAPPLAGVSSAAGGIR